MPLKQSYINASYADVRCIHIQTYSDGLTVFFYVGIQEE